MKGPLGIVDYERVMKDIREIRPKAIGDAIGFYISSFIREIIRRRIEEFWGKYK